MSVSFSRLGELLLAVKNVSPTEIHGNGNFTYVDISSVSRDEKCIANPQLVSANEAPSRARQELAVSDVIVSTVRPNLNTVAAVGGEHANAIASTGFCVLRPNTKVLDARYLFHWVSSDGTVAKLTSLATGATYPAVSDKTIKSLELRLPSMEEQRRIAVILDKVDSLRRKRQQAIRLADDLLRAVFINMFDRLPRIKTLGAYCEVLSGFAFKSDHYVPADAGPRLLRGVNVGIGAFEWSDAVSYPEHMTTDLQRYRLREGDVILAMDRPWISSGLKCAVIDRDQAGHLLVQRVARLRPNSPENAAFIFLSLRHPTFRAHCRVTETTIPHISPTDLATLPVPDVSAGDMAQFSRVAARIAAMKRSAQLGAYHLNQLLTSLQAKLLA